MPATNRWKWLSLSILCDGIETLPSNWIFALCTNATAPTADTERFSELTEIASGNGYAPLAYPLNTTQFPSNVIDNNQDWCTMSVRDVEWVASGGPIPATGNGARWLVMLDDNPTPADRWVLHYWDLGVDRSVNNNEALIVNNVQIRHRT